MVLYSAFRKDSNYTDSYLGTYNTHNILKMQEITS